jgi:NADPH:quinone reductase-like Zn-dependent oxidoreductase
MPRVVRFHETGGPEVLRIETIDVAAPGLGEIQIAVKAIGINRAEAMFRAGAYLEAPNLPARLGYEAAGTITALGPDVTGFSIGQRVSSVPGFSMNKYGAYGEVINLPAWSIVSHPDKISDVQAAAVWMQYVTAWGALIEIGKLTAGEAVLIPAASSSVGLAAIQIATMIGATPIALTRTSTKAEALKAAGAAHVIATEEQDLVAEVKPDGWQRRAHGVRSRRRSDGQPALRGAELQRLAVSVRRTVDRTDASAAFHRAWKITHGARVYPVRIYPRSDSAGIAARDRLRLAGSC